MNIAFYQEILSNIKSKFPDDNLCIYLYHNSVDDECYFIDKSGKFEAGQTVNVNSIPTKIKSIVKG